ncbi:MAG: diaminobutyrate--2-oxoglutarate transaminase [Candidatus Sericytochromatia bacterium]
MNNEVLKQQYDLFLSGASSLPGQKREVKSDTKYLVKQAERESNARSYPRRLPIAIAEAKGVYIKDTNGNVYIDCLAGAGSLALGHNHPVVQEAIINTVKSDLPLLTLDLTTPVKEEFVDEIFGCLPHEFAKDAKIQFCSPSGADAIEAATKLVKHATGRRTMMAFHGGYHGMTHGALSMMGNLGPKNNISGLMADVHFMPYSNYGNVEPKWNLNYIENVLTDPESGIVKPAGMLMEVVQGEGGVIPSDDEWLRQIRRITKENDVPLMIDEVQTGMGRTGKIFAFEHSGIIPDVLVLSKAIGGSLPLAVVIYNKSLDKWGPGSHAGTFRGNQMAMAAGIATIKYMKNNNLIEHVNNMGNKLRGMLEQVMQSSNFISEVRGRGLMLGVQIVNKENNGKPYGELARIIQRECFERGLVIEVGGRDSGVVRFLPPLIINENQIDTIGQIFAEAVKAAEGKVA